MIFGCTPTQAWYGTDKAVSGQVALTGTSLIQDYILKIGSTMDVRKWNSTTKDSANGNPIAHKILYNRLLQSIDSRDTLGILISSLGNPDYIKYAKHKFSLAFTDNMTIYEFLPATIEMESQNWKLVNQEPIKFQIPELIGNKPLVVDSSGKRQISTAPAKTIAVMDFSGGGISTGEAQALTERLRLELFNVGSFKLLERGLMEQVLQEQGFQQSGCTDSECMVQVGNLIGVELMIGGSISKVGTVHSVSAKIFSVTTGEIVKTAQLDFRGDIGDLMLGGMRKIAEDLSDY